MNFGVVGQPAGQLLYDGARVGRGVHADVVALEGAHEGFHHIVRLRRADRHNVGHETDVAGDAASIANDIRATVIAEPFDG